MDFIINDPCSSILQFWSIHVSISFCHITILQSTILLCSVSVLPNAKTQWAVQEVWKALQSCCVHVPSNPSISVSTWKLVQSCHWLWSRLAKTYGTRFNINPCQTKFIGGKELSYIINTKTADGLATQKVRAPAAIVSALFWNIQVSAPQEFMGKLLSYPILACKLQC